MENESSLEFEERPDAVLVGDERGLLALAVPVEQERLGVGVVEDGLPHGVGAVPVLLRDDDAATLGGLGDGRLEASGHVRGVVGLAQLGQPQQETVGVLLVEQRVGIEHDETQ